MAGRSPRWSPPIWWPPRIRGRHWLKTPSRWSCCPPQTLHRCPPSLSQIMERTFNGLPLSIANTTRECSKCSFLLSSALTRNFWSHLSNAAPIMSTPWFNSAKYARWPKTFPWPPNCLSAPFSFWNRRCTSTSVWRRATADWTTGDRKTDPSTSCCSSTRSTWRNELAAAPPSRSPNCSWVFSQTQILLPWF